MRSSYALLSLVLVLPLTSCRWGYQLFDQKGNTSSSSGGQSSIGGGGGADPGSGGAAPTGGEGGAGPCDGAPETIYYADADEDGFGDPTTGTAACDPPDGMVEDDTDCADDPDSDPACNDLPGASCSPALVGQDVCDGADNDCDGSLDEECAIALPVTSGLILWLDASDPATLSTDPEVFEWRDKSGFDHHMVQEESGRKPLAQAGPNGRTVVRFDGVGDYMETPNDSAFDGNLLTILLVISPRWTTDLGWNPSPFAIRGEQGGDTRISVHVGGENDWFGTFNAIGVASLQYDIVANDFYFLDLQRVSGNLDHFVNGQLELSETQALGTTLNMPVRIGAAEDDFENFDGDIAEVVIYNRGLTALERQSLNAYIETKWGIDTSP